MKNIKPEVMKKLWKIMSIALLAIAGMFSLTSCDGDDDYWWSGPPYGWDSFNDTRLNGYWALRVANSMPVSADQANYYYFNNGRGEYYWLENGYEEDEDIRYWCQQGDGSTNYQINIQYEGRSPSTLNYQLENHGNTLMIQWYDSNVGKSIVYYYDRIGGAPW